MPIPLIVGAAAVLVGGTGIAAGVSGTKKVSEANRRIESASEKYESNQKKMEKQENSTMSTLEALGALKMAQFEELDRFITTFEKIHNRPEMTEVQGEGIEIPKHNLDKIERVQIKAVELFGTVAAGAGAGALAGFATYGGVMTLGVASTGAPIAGLYGAAATKATLAALGGGSIAAGGGGIALGTQILGGAVAAPIIAVGGLLLNAKGNDSLEKAREVESKVDDAVDKLKGITKFLSQLKEYGVKLKTEIESIAKVYDTYVSRLEYIVERERDYNKYDLQDKQVVNNSAKITQVMYSMLVQDLLEVQKEDSKEIPTIKKEEINKITHVSEELVDSLADA